MDINTAPSLEEKNAGMKVVKLRLPVRFIIQLQFLKLTRRHDVSTIVAHALADYFQSHPMPQAQVNGEPVPQPA